MIDLLSSTEVFMEKAGQLNGLPLLEQLPANHFNISTATVGRIVRYEKRFA